MKDFEKQAKSIRDVSAPQKAAVPHIGPGTPPASSARPAPTHENIARRAYDIYNAKGGEAGHCKQNWQQAERELHTSAATTCSSEHNEALPTANACCEPAGKTVAAAPSKHSVQSMSHSGGPHVPTASSGAKS